MAIFESLEYSRLASPARTPKNNAHGASPRNADFYYTQVALGTIGDTINLVRIDCPRMVVDMFKSWFLFTGWTATATLSIGWRAYTDVDGVPVAEDAAGLLSAVLLTADGAWSHGMLVVATPDDSLPVVGRKVFNNRGAVTLFATIGVAAPGAGDILNGSFCFKTP